MMARTLLVVCAVVLALGAPVAAQDQSYPARQVELVVPFPAGGAADVGARMVAQIVSENWAQPIIIQNKAGATGAIGSEYVARATPDGYTLLLATGSTHAVRSRCAASGRGRSVQGAGIHAGAQYAGRVRTIHQRRSRQMAACRA
jgi:tripartite-type tricarboxylate transporter receptor subunit TctC